MKDPLKAYRGKQVLVTGITGFKGQWLSRWLKQLGAEVSGFGLPMDDHGLADKNDPSIHILDICDRQAVLDIVERTRPEVVFHLAAQPLVRESYQTPVETFATNVLGTVHLLDAVRQCKSVQAVVNVTSDKCYENREWHWPYRENEAMGGYDPYSASKGCSELVTASYRRSFFEGERTIGLASGRAGNVIGGGDWAADRLVPDIIRCLIDEKEILLRRPMAIRPWQHVLEAVCGYLTLGANLLENPLEFSGGWNFGPSDLDAVNVRNLAKQIVQVWGDGTIVEAPNSSNLHEAHYLKLDSSKARHTLQWSPLLSMEERIEWTVAWYRDWNAGSLSASELVDAQVKQYAQRWSTWMADQLAAALPKESRSAQAA